MSEHLLLGDGDRGDRTEYVVLVGTRANEDTVEPDGEGFEAIGPLRFEQATKYAEEYREAFAKVPPGHFRYGTPVVEVTRLTNRIGPPEAVISNWHMDPAEVDA